MSMGPVYRMYANSLKIIVIIMGQVEDAEDQHPVHTHTFNGNRIE